MELPRELDRVFRTIRFVAGICRNPEVGPEVRVEHRDHVIRPAVGDEPREHLHEPPHGVDRVAALVRNGGRIREEGPINEAGRIQVIGVGHEPEPI